MGFQVIQFTPPLFQVGLVQSLLSDHLKHPSANRYYHSLGETTATREIKRSYSLQGVAQSIYIHRTHSIAPVRPTMLQSRDRFCGKHGTPPYWHRRSSPHLNLFRDSPAPVRPGWIVHDQVEHLVEYPWAPFVLGLGLPNRAATRRRLSKQEQSFAPMGNLF